MFLGAKVLEDAAIVSEDKRVEGEFHLFVGLAVTDDEVKKLAEENSDFLLLFMPASNIL